MKTIEDRLDRAAEEVRRKVAEVPARAAIVILVAIGAAALVLPLGGRGTPSGESSPDTAAPRDVAATTTLEQVATTVPEQVATTVPEQVATTVPEQVAATVPEQVAATVPEQVVATVLEQVGPMPPGAPVITWERIDAPGAFDLAEGHFVGTAGVPTAATPGQTIETILAVEDCPEGLGCGDVAGYVAGGRTGMQRAFHSGTELDRGHRSRIRR